MKPKSIRDVAEGHLCTGCGACEYMEPGRITMVNITDRGIRPRISSDATIGPETLATCPGAGLTHTYDRTDEHLIATLEATWGPVYGVWEGYASDPEIRFAGSSAGAATVLALHGLENENMQGVVHIAADPDAPFLNRTVFSTTRAELVNACGSRYAPASPCTGLGDIERSDGPCVFIGKPCDVAAAQAARRFRPRLDANLALTIGIFCAGTPSTQGTLEMLKAMGVDVNDLASVRYRGNGWPGPAEAVTESGESRQLTYDQSWGDILQKHRQWRCYVCADHTGEFADIAVGDPWYREVDGSDPGRSLIVTRTARGREYLQRAIDGGHLTAWPVNPDLLAQSQPNLEQTRGAVWGRIQMLRLARAFAPTFDGLPMFHIWRTKLSVQDKIVSTIGTLRRVRRKGLRHREASG